ncbi:hypothetical protein [Verrucosispora sp. TAA-831]|uniref:hypothetical protein n=1 Tax=Verrucosispora sp. TAA-831 TaxID=3422227 RepID=UPI003D6F7DE5
MTAIDARTIAADIMTMNARDVTEAEVWAHIGQAYDARDVDPAVVAEALTLIAEAGIDLTWPDGTASSELDAQRLENARLTAELVKAQEEIARMRGEAQTRPDAPARPPVDIPRHPTFAAVPPALRAAVDQRVAEIRQELDVITSTAARTLRRGVEPGEIIALLAPAMGDLPPVVLREIAAAAVVECAVSRMGVRAGAVNG